MNWSTTAIWCWFFYFSSCFGQETVNRSDVLRSSSQAVTCYLPPNQR